MAARKRRGVCPFCRRYLAVTWETELMWLHKFAGLRCPGTGRPPLGQVD